MRKRKILPQIARGTKRATPSPPVAGPMSSACRSPSAPTRFAPIISARADAAVRSSAGHSAWLSIDHTAPTRRSATQRSSTGAAHDAYETAGEEGGFALYDEQTDNEHPDGPAAAQAAELKGKTGNDKIDGVMASANALKAGITGSLADVKVKVPFIIRGQLREYQHVALDWLVSMYEKNLNGILADEMGLGKTLMTISTLAWLACEKGIWGPHLIVVPTSVMVNWEMEIKKFAPAFKILTYFGSQKERRLKRQGWSKTNAFHICITSCVT